MEEKKPWYKLPQLWVLVGFVVVLGIFIITTTINTQRKDAQVASSKKKSSKISESSEYAKDSSKLAESLSSEISAASSREASSKAAEQDPAQYKTGITFDQIARTPDDYEGKKIELTGKVLQVMEDDDYTEIRLAVDGDYDNVILVDIDSDIMNGSRILEDDLVTVSGVSDGTTTYESTSGAKITIPAMTAKIVNDQGKASDDYGY
ncbi:hypothetical protein QMA60_06225 [Leuconostoc suionicum]|uniref:hypothetical protein n=1 Tax=Leuconostoc suionicum TaxID=1511761 RepID=UPI0024ADA0A9|nr:hypothetical protein [Leuconostoc suionicum]MDI6497924.1 hypothetical protein [Leuconostoc suionicum]MDI6500005.1 hypothetical protein [Leuconostoc suionicum]MDI6502350.1 hypothetical protein [Leuconostoc suionicum]MDI6613983.1 hypothetical protein [Leuconostoc suionicum]MDI6665214.1 hypothetical protein [Leuconostoc suionicum]